MREKLGYKVRHGLPREVQLDLERVVGDDLRRSTGRWLRIERTINWEKDAYAERLPIPRTGDAGRDLCGPPQLQRELTRTLLGSNHASPCVLIWKHKCRSMPRRLRVIADTNRSFVRAGGCRRV